MGTESTVQPPTSPSQANTRQCDSKAKQGVLSFNVGILLSTTSDSVFRVSLVSSMVKNLPPVQETWVQSLGWEDFLEKGIETHSSILAWRIPVGRGVWQATVHGVAKSRPRVRAEAAFSSLPRTGPSSSDVQLEKKNTA